MPSRLDFEPRDWQPAAIDHLIRTPKAGLFMRPGMGKTPVTLYAIRQLLAARAINRVLVLAPKRVADLVWPKELDKWSFTKDICYRKLGADWRHRLTQPTEAQIDIASFEKVASRTVRRKGREDHYPGLVELWQRAKHWPYDLVVIDESTRVKNHSAAVFKALKKTVNVTDRIAILTGSFISRDVQDAWAQIYLLDRGKRLGENVTRFRERYCYRDHFNQWHAHPGAENEVTDLVSDICLSMRLEDYVDIEQPQEIDIPVYLTDDLAQQYREFEREMLMELGGGQTVAANAAVLSGKCRQFANGAMYLTDENGQPSREWRAVHDLKLEALEELVEEVAEPVVISYAYQPDLERLRKLYPKALTPHDDDFLDRWQRGQSDVLLLHPKSAAHGLDGLQDRCRTVIVYSGEWSYELYDQLIERVGPTRQLQSGHPRSVFVYRLVVEGTVDELICERWRTRESIHDILMRGLRRAA